MADVKISSGISMPVVKSPPISGFLQIIYLPLTVSLLIEFEEKCSGLLCICATAWVFEGSNCSINQIIHHRHVLFCMLYIYWPLFLDECFPDQT